MYYIFADVKLSRSLHSLLNPSRYPISISVDLEKLVCWWISFPTFDYWDRMFLKVPAATTKIHNEELKILHLCQTHGARHQQLQQHRLQLLQLVQRHQPQQQHHQGQLQIFSGVFFCMKSQYCCTFACGKLYATQSNITALHWWHHFKLMALFQIGGVIYKLMTSLSY